MTSLRQIRFATQGDMLVDVVRSAGVVVDIQGTFSVKMQSTFGEDAVSIQCEDAVNIQSTFSQHSVEMQ
jgi:hypothetical protein